MSTFCITVDEKRCIQCHACEIHCQVNMGTPPTVRPARLRTVAPHSENGALVQRSIFFHCFHCETPHCLRVCPSSAIRRRSRDGIVYIVSGLCTGCQACVMACPWRLPQWSTEREHIFKCDLCHERLDAGQLPACVAGCTTGALTLTNDPTVLAAGRALREASLHDGGHDGGHDKGHDGGHTESATSSASPHATPHSSLPSDLLSGPLSGPLSGTRQGDGSW